MPDAATSLPEPLPDLRDRIPGVMSSVTIGKLVGALAAAKNEFLAIDKDQTADAGRYKYDYAELATVLAATTPALSKFKLAVLQPPHQNGMQAVSVTTIIAHESGEWMASVLLMPVGDPKDPQKVGSALSYARRYGYLAALGIAAKGEDDDGTAAADRQASTKRATRAAEVAATDVDDERPITTKGADGKGDGQLGRLKALMKEHRVDKKKLGGYINETYGYQAWSEIKRKHYQGICDLIQSGTFDELDEVSD
jgi:ERF superfamily